MYKRADKEKYEKLIQESPLFSLDKKAEPVAFRNARLKMIENIYLYLLSINKEKYEPYGCEITEIAVLISMIVQGVNFFIFLIMNGRRNLHIQNMKKG